MPEGRPRLADWWETAEGHCQEQRSEAIAAQRRDTSAIYLKAGKISFDRRCIMPSLSGTS
jgi:hypothetical protein